jgi:hypothetical protein
VVIREKKAVASKRSMYKIQLFQFDTNKYF